MAEPTTREVIERAIQLLDMDAALDVGAARKELQVLLDGGLEADREDAMVRAEHFHRQVGITLGAEKFRKRVASLFDDPEQMEAREEMGLGIRRRAAKYIRALPLREPDDG